MDLISCSPPPRLIASSPFTFQFGKAGYKAVRRRIGNVITREWIVYQKDTDEINALKKTIKRISVTPVTANFSIYTYPRTGKVIQIAFTLSRCHYCLEVRG